MDHEKKKQLIIKICCVVAAVLLRFYVSNVENPIVEYNIKNVPVTIVNEEKLKNSGLILVEEEGYNVNLTVKGPTNQVSKLTKKDFLIFADLEALALKKGENKILVSVDDYPDGINILQNQHMLISIELDAYIEREFKVNVTHNGATESGYYAHETVLDPEIVKIAGGEKQLDKINKVIANIDLANANNDINKEVELIVTDSTGEKMEGLTVYPSKIKVRIPVNKTKSVPIIVDKIGTIDPNLQVKSIVTNIKTVKISGDDADLKLLESIKTEPVDLSKMTATHKENLKLIVPDGIVILGNSKSVEVDIEVENIIEKSIINVIIDENLESGYEANLQFNTINVTLRGPESLLEKIDYRNIHCKVDLQGLTEGTHIVPVIVDVPENIELIASDVESIKVDIVKKEPEEKTTDPTATENEELVQQNPNEEVPKNEVPQNEAPRNEIPNKEGPRLDKKIRDENSQNSIDAGL